MSARRLRILQLMAQREQREIGLASAQLGALRQHAAQQFDLVDRLDQLIAQSAVPAASTVSRGNLLTSQFLQQAMLTQRDAAAAQLSALHSACQDQMATLGAHQQRRTVLSDHAEATRRSLQATAADAALPAPSKPRNKS